MADIPPPTMPLEDPERFLHCQDALEVEFQSFVDRATAAGWQEGEVISAIIALADNHALMIAEEGTLGALLERLRKQS